VTRGVTTAHFVKTSSAGGGRGGDRRWAQEGSVAGAAAPVTSRRELEALILDEADARCDHVSVERNPGVLSHLGQGDGHAQRGAVGSV
jgi:hypothetical protein